MRHLYCFLLLLLPSLLAAQVQPITLEDIWQKGTFQSKGIPGFNFQNDGVHYTRLQGNTIEQYDFRTGEKTSVLFDAKSIESDATDWNGTFDGYTFSPDESKILLSAGTEAIYRRSSKTNYYVYDFKSKQLSRLYEGQKQSNALFSPDGQKIGFCAINDVFFKDLQTGKTTRVSVDGKKNEVINGSSDWVYEEEFEIVRAFDWSPDGKYIAYLRFDEREVPQFSMEEYHGKSYPDIETFKYPKVGEKNSVVTAWIYDLGAQQTRSVNTGAAADDYLPRLQWTPSRQLCVTWMNRLQNNEKLLLADPATGNCSTLLEEKNKYYIDLHDVRFLNDGSGFVKQSEKSGFNHLYYYDMQGKEKNAVTSGKWDVTDFYGIDEENGLVYFQAAAKNPMQREIYVVKLNGKKQKQISDAAGYHGAQFSNTFDFFVDNFSTVNSAPQYVVRDRNGKLLRELEKNAQIPELQTKYGVQPVQFFNFKTSEDVMLNGWMLRPSDPKFAGQKLPVLMFVYGGPGSQQVLDQWKGANYWWFQMLAQQGYVVACVDNRGTGARGEAFKKMTYKQLGHYETIDQIEAAKYLGQQDYVDKDRIGIFGWSYGGYMSSLCILKGADVFKAAIAVAPVTNWKWYDSVYTERYMQTTELNPEGYDENSPVNFANKLEGNYLIVHGMADDNVHYQNSAEMVNQLISKNKDFDSMIYPNRNHGITGDNARLHLYTLMTNFLDKKLKKVTDKP